MDSVEFTFLSMVCICYYKSNRKPYYKLSLTNSMLDYNQELNINNINNMKSLLTIALSLSLMSLVSTFECHLSR